MPASVSPKCSSTSNRVVLVVREGSHGLISGVDHRQEAVSPSAPSTTLHPHVSVWPPAMTLQPRASLAACDDPSTATCVCCVPRSGASGTCDPPITSGPVKYLSRSLNSSSPIPSSSRAESRVAVGF